MSLMHSYSQAGPIQPLVQLRHTASFSSGSKMQSPRPLQSSGQSGSSQPMPSQPLSHSHCWVSSSQVPCPLQLSPMPGQPRISHCSPYQPRFRPSSSRCSHSQVPPLHVPWPEHSTSQPSPEKQASHTHVPELRENSVPLMHGRLQSTPIHPSSQLMQRGVSSGKP